MMTAAGITAPSAVRMLELIYNSRLQELAEDAQFDQVRPQGNLFDTILPLARRIADDLTVDARLTHALAELDW